MGVRLYGVAAPSIPGWGQIQTFGVVIIGVEEGETPKFPIPNEALGLTARPLLQPPIGQVMEEGRSQHQRHRHPGYEDGASVGQVGCGVSVEPVEIGVLPLRVLPRFLLPVRSDRLPRHRHDRCGPRAPPPRSPRTPQRPNRSTSCWQALLPPRSVKRRALGQPLTRGRFPFCCKDVLFQLPSGAACLFIK